MSVDSRFIGDKERKKIHEACINCDESHIIITHGTITLADTATYLGEREREIDKTIVIVGSMIPGNMAHSDASFNIGFAFGVVQLLPKGVYVTMNGKIFPYDSVQKNCVKGVFETVNQL